MNADDAFRILHHGAVRGVTGSCHELRLADGNALLVDCGLFQGAETSEDGAGSGAPAIDFPVEHVRALVLTHVHIDHCGRVPYLFAAGFDGPIYCSVPSAILLPLVLQDALAVGASRDRQLVERAVSAIEQRLVPIPYGQWHRVARMPQIEIRLQRAGHILGSAYVECRLTLARTSAFRPTDSEAATVGLKPDLRGRG